MLKAAINLSLMTLVGLFAGCGIESSLRHLPDDVFQAEPEYDRELESVGDLAKAYAENTYGLRKSNNKLKTLCVAARRCEDEGLE